MLVGKCAIAKLIEKGGKVFKKIDLSDPTNVHTNLDQLANTLVNIYQHPPYRKQTENYNERTLECALYGMLVFGSCSPICQRRVNHSSDKKDYSILDLCSLEFDHKILVFETKYSNCSSNTTGLEVILSKGYLKAAFKKQSLKQKYPQAEWILSKTMKKKQTEICEQIKLLDNTHFLLAGLELAKGTSDVQINIRYLLDSIDINHAVTVSSKTLKLK